MRQVITLKVWLITLETMHRATSRVSFLPDFWLTHPLTTERMSEARLRANQLPRVKNRIYDADFEILKWYTMVVANQANENQLQSLASQKKYCWSDCFSGILHKTR